MIAESIPNHIQKYIDKVNETGIFPPKSLANHVLLNEYKQGEGILSHFDGPLFFPTITTLSIGSHAVLEFNKPPTEDNFQQQTEFKLLVEPRSLLILKDDLYSFYMHSISEICEDDLSDELISNCKNTKEVLVRSTRYSLTIRNVPNTSKLKLKFFK